MPTDDGVPADDGAPGDDGMPADDMPGGECEALQGAACDGAAGCGAGESCFRGVCLRDCGADLSAWDAALPAGVVPHANVCTQTGILAVAGNPACVGGATVFRVVASSRGGSVEYDLRSGPLETGPDAVFANATAPTNGLTHFISQNAAASPDGMKFAWGYTLSDVSGEVLVADRSGTVQRIASGGNYDIDWLDDDRLLINGLSAEGAASTGQGIYEVDWGGAAPVARRLTTGPGASSGSVAYLPRRDAVLAGGFGSSGVVYLIPAADLGPSTIDLASSGHPMFEVPSDYEVLGGRWVAGFDATFSAFEYRVLEGDSLSAPQPFVDFAVFPEMVTIQGADRFLLVHDDGYVIVSAP